nr:hypothetical protein CFP56_11534 [Quercus suber]
MPSSAYSVMALDELDRSLHCVDVLLSTDEHTWLEKDWEDEVVARVGSVPLACYVPAGRLPDDSYVIQCSLQFSNHTSGTAEYPKGSVHAPSKVQQAQHCSTPLAGYIGVRYTPLPAYES